VQFRLFLVDHGQHRAQTVRRTDRAALVQALLSGDVVTEMALSRGERQQELGRCDQLLHPQQVVGLDRLPDRGDGLRVPAPGDLDPGDGVERVGPHRHAMEPADLQQPVDRRRGPTRSPARYSPYARLLRQLTCRVTSPLRTATASASS
jgi:hypothetical protein